MRITHTILLGLLALPCRSQEKTVSTEIVTIALDDQVGGLFFHNGREVCLFQANTTGLGEPLKYNGPPRLLLRTSKEEFSHPPPLPAAHAGVDLPPGSDRVLLACLKSGGAPLRISAFDIGSARVGAGDYRFFNFSRSAIAIVLGDRKLAVKPGSNTLVSGAPWGKSVTEIDVAMAVIRDGQPKPVYSSQWGHRPGRRNYIFLFDGPQAFKPIRICRYFDVPPSPARAPGT